MKVLFCGYGRAALECLYQLIGHYGLKSADLLVFTHKEIQNDEFVDHLNHNGIKFLYSNINESIEIIKNFSADYLLSVYYKNVLSIDVLNIVNNKAMNLHLSLLPSYKGIK